jgi:hypothetical protein
VSRSQKYNSVDDLADDDQLALEQLTGALYDGDPVGRRLARTPKIKRNCSPACRKDRQLTALFYERVAFHEPRVQAMEADAKDQLDHIEALLEHGDIRSVKDVPEEFIVRGLVRAATDTRRPTVQLKALQALAEMKGLAKPNDRSSPADVLEDMLSQFEARATKRPRALPPAAKTEVP